MGAFVFLAGWSGVTVAQSTLGSEEYARMARKAFSAWECYALADIAHNKTEAERLFRLGYELGKTAVEAARAGRVTQEDWSRHAPLLITMSLGGPSVDFSLGRIHEGIFEHVYKDILKDITDSNLRKTQADFIYQKHNCFIIK